MLNMNNIDDKQKMMNYYRTSDMLNLLFFFPKLSPVKNLTIVESEEDYNTNFEELRKLDKGRIDSPKDRPMINGIEVSGLDFLSDLVNAKKIDPNSVLVLFNLDSQYEERYEHFAGISVGINVGESVSIEAVSKGFDGREVSKSICTHERYFIPWYELRKLNIGNFKNYQTYQINDKDYQKTRNDRIKFLESVGFDEKKFSKCIPEYYQEIPKFIWQSVISNLLKQLEKNEDILISCGFKNFAISGHTEGNIFAPWQMFDKSRYAYVKH